MLQVSPRSLLVSLYLVGGIMSHFNNQVPEIESGNSIHAQTCIKRNSFRFRRTACDRCLFLTRQNLWDNMCDCQACTEFLPKSILSLQDLRQSQSLETVPICIVVRYFPHDNIAETHSGNACKILNERSVCHMLWSIF